jgi:hypothetical protein
MLVLYTSILTGMGVRRSWLHCKPRIAFAVFGLTAGILAGTVNVMLSVLIIFALEMQMPKNVMIQVFNFCFLFVKLTEGGFAQAGLMTADALTASAPLAGLALVVMLMGMRISNRIPAETYRRRLRRLLVVLAEMLMVQFFVR